MKVTEHTATADLYKRGLRTPASNKQGYTLDRKKPADAEDEVIIKKGQKYYSWKRKGNDQRTYSLEPYVYVKPYNEWDEKIGEFNSSFEEVCESDDDDAKDELREQIEEYRDELQDRLGNMPDQLQDGHILNERIEELEGMISDLES